jgi:hypothetical protein
MTPGVTTGIPTRLDTGLASGTSCDTTRGGRSRGHHTTDRRPKLLRSSVGVGGAGPSDLCHSRGMPPHTFEDAGGGQFAEQAHDLGAQFLHRHIISRPQRIVLVASELRSARTRMLMSRNLLRDCAAFPQICVNVLSFATRALELSLMDALK